MSDCVFCQIAASDSSAVLLDTPHVLAFLDIQPLVASKAHVLVIPRKHFETLDELSDDEDTSRELGLWLPRVARALKEVNIDTNSDGTSGTFAYNVVQNNGESAGQVVPHVHFHFVVRNRAQTDVSDAVSKVKSHLPWRDRLNYEATTFGKGLREELDSAHASNFGQSLKHALQAKSKL